MRTSTLSIRLVWPFLRVRSDPEGAAFLVSNGIDLRALADPDTRLPHALTMKLLEHAVRRSGDETLGLRAAEALEAGDLGALEYAARSCDDLRSALACLRRYLALVNDSVVASLEESGATATWRLSVVDGVEQHPCADDFQLACGVVLSRRLTGEDPALVEAHFVRPAPRSTAAHDRVFECRLRFGMPVNALVFRRAHLETPLRLANPGLQAAYSLHAEEELRHLSLAEDIVSRVRGVLVSHLRTGDVGIRTVARAAATSPATLRRRLAKEGTSLSALLDEVRRDLTGKYLRDPTLAITEVAFLLGFSHVPGFYKAFQRWYPKRTPADLRRELRNEKPLFG